MRLWLFLFIKIGVLDLLVTWFLVSGGNAYEANPLAAKILRAYGWSGLISLKAGCLVFVSAVGMFLSRRHLSAARRLFHFGCGINGAIVAYGLALLLHVHHDLKTQLAAANTRSTSLERLTTQSREYFAKLDDLAQAARKRRLRLTEAAKQLTLFTQEAGYDPFVFLNIYHKELGSEGKLASHVLHQAAYQLRDQPGRARRILPRLRAEFVYYYGTPTQFTLEYFPKPAPRNCRPRAARIASNGCASNGCSTPRRACHLRSRLWRS